MNTAFDKEVKKEVLINASALKVWAILTEPQWTKQWVSDNGLVKIISEYKVGSSIVFKGKWHGADWEDKGTILKFEPGKVFSYNYWSNHNNVPDMPENYSNVEFVLKEENGQTTLNFTATNMLSYEAYGHVNYYWGITLGIIKRMAEEKVT